MRILVVGYGSIGARHSRIASGLGMRVACVSSNADCPYPCFDNVAKAVDNFAPHSVLIANATSKHAVTVSELVRAGFDGKVLIEKPVTSSLQEIPELGQMSAFAAYNLRFHPLVKELREQLVNLPMLYSASFTAGQYLPQWRPGADYRQSYSASVEQGGGVLRDLSHEIDLALWLCGPAQRVAALGGHFSDLDISSDDVYSMLSVNDLCPSVSININYLNYMPQRMISFNGPKLSVLLDLITGILILNGESNRISVERDATYISQLKAFVEGDNSVLCKFTEAVDVVRFIGAAEVAAASNTWIKL